jgi:DNA polymerase III alpha subunit
MAGSTGSGVVMFVPLHTKSHYSPGYGVAAVEALVGRVAAHGYAGLALTDVENFYGQVEFHDAARRHGRSWAVVGGLGRS